MPLTHAPGVTAESTGSRVIALDQPGANVITLSPVGSIIWEHLAEPATLPQIVEALREIFADVPADRLEADAAAFIEELLELGLLVDQH